MARAEEYFQSHAIDPNLAARCGVRTDDSGIIFPYGGFERRRSLLKKATWQPAGEPLTLYWPRRTASMRAALGCEGESDTLAALTALPSLVVVPFGIPGVGMPTQRIIDQLLNEGIRKVWWALDNDEAGQRKTDDLAIAGTRAGLQSRRLQLPKDRDLSDVLAALGPSYLRILFATSKPALSDSLRAKMYLSLTGEQQRGSEAARRYTYGPERVSDELRAIPAETYALHLVGEEPNERGFISCPFHDDRTPSLKLGGDKPTLWYCFGACQSGGDIFTFAQQLWQCDFKRARERLEETFE